LLRKTGHFIGYGVLSLVMFRGWWTTLSLRRRKGRLPSWRDMLRDWSACAAGLSLVSTAAVAALDEWHQQFLPGRGSSSRDVILDSAAALCVQMLLIALSQTRRVEKKQLAISN
jgi:VanZ family protein